MKHSDFQEQHHWLCGFSEYFRFTESYDDDFELVFRALYHDNKYRKRDLLINMAKKYARKDLASIKDAKLEQMDDTVQTFFNIAMHSELDDYDIKARSLIGFLAWYIPEESLIQRTARFMAYFANKDIDIPNLGDFYSRGQVRSKIWLIEELAKVIGNDDMGNVVFYGGWYNFLAHFLYEQFNIHKVFSLDLDESVVGPCKRLYAEELDNDKFHPYTCDVNKLVWNTDTQLSFLNHERRDQQIKDWHLENDEKLKQGIITEADKDSAYANFGQRYMSDINLVINTSCEHMNNDWFDALPDGKLVVLHQNDYFSNEQHVNCMKDIEDTKANYPMQEIYYEGTLDTHLYNRFMLIGRK